MNLRKNQPGYARGKDILGRVSWKKTNSEQSRHLDDAIVNDVKFQGESSLNHNDIQEITDDTIDYIEEKYGLTTKVISSQNNRQDFQIADNRFIRFEHGDNEITLTMYKQHYSSYHDRTEENPFYQSTIKYDNKEGLENHIAQFVDSRIEGFQYETEPRNFDDAKTMLDNNMYGFHSESELNKQYRDLYEKDIQHYINTYGAPWTGNARATFDIGDNKVLKIALGYQGEIENNQELSRIESDPDMFTRGHGDLSPHGLPVLITEKVQPIEFDDPDMPDWADMIDGRQIGRTSDGRIVAYDV